MYLNPDTVCIEGAVVHDACKLQKLCILCIGSAYWLDQSFNVHSALCIFLYCKYSMLQNA
mgnify:CR=1 FL=1